MIKLKPLLFESKILVPRRSPEEREKTLIAEIYRIIQRYIKDGCQGDLNLSRSPIKILPDNLTHVGGSLNLSYSKIKDLNNLERVDEDLDLYRSIKLKSLGKLKYVNWTVDLRYTNIETLENLDTVGRSLNIVGCSNLKSLNKLKKIGDSFDADDAINLKNLGELEYVETVAFFAKHNTIRIIRKIKTRSKIIFI